MERFQTFTSFRGDPGQGGGKVTQISIGPEKYWFQSDTFQNS